MRTLIRETTDRVGQTVTISGWVDARRDMGKIVFLDLRDRTGLLQVVCTQSVSLNFSPSSRGGARGGAGEFKEVGFKDLKPGFVLRITGSINERGPKAVNPKLTTGRIELKAESIDVLATAQPSPFDATGELGLDTYLDHLPYTLRTERARAIFHVQSEIVEAFRAFLRSQGFTEFQAPKIVGGATEGGANVFTVDYFDKKAFLAQSPQFYKQIMVGVFERVFTVGNVYRAELHATSRHINEYTSLDLEFGFIEDHRDVMRLENDLLLYMVEHLKKTCGHYFSPSPGEGEREGVGSPLFDVHLPIVPKDIPVVKLREAQEILGKEFGISCVGEPDLDPEHERKLCEWAQRVHGSDFLFVTHFPTSKRPFYTMPDPADPEVTLGFDLLFRGIEITTGSQRIHDYDQLVASMRRHNLNPDHFKYYLEAFQYGLPPEGGFALGLERLTAKFLGIENVKEATLFPRDIGRIDERLVSSPVVLFRGPKMPTIQNLLSPVEEDYRFIQVRIQAGSTEDVSVKSIIAIQSGTAPRDSLINIKLMDDTNHAVLGIVQALDARGRAVFDGLDAQITRGEHVNLSIFATLRPNSAGHTVGFELHDGVEYTIRVLGASSRRIIPPSRNDFCTTAGVVGGACQLQKVSSLASRM